MRGKTITLSGLSAVRMCGAVMIMLLLCRAGTAQTLPFREYSPDDGLPPMENAFIMQDSRGYFWIASRNGLTLFDGYNSKTFRHKEGLPSNNVSRVIEDTGGNIWASTAKGIARFNGTDFTGYLPPSEMKLAGMTLIPGAAGPGRFFIVGFVSDGSSRLIYFNNGHFTDYTSEKPALKKFTIGQALYDAHDSTIYFTDMEGKIAFFRNGSLTYNEQETAVSLDFENDRVVYSTRDGRKFINDSTVLIPGKTVYNPEHPGLIMNYSGNPDHMLLTDGNDSIVIHWNKEPVLNTFFDRENVLWLMTENHLYKLLSTAFRGYSKEDGLLENPWAIAADNKGGLLIGSLNGGLQYFDGKSFTPVHGYEDLFPGVDAFYRGSMTSSSGEVWLSTNVGVIKRNGSGFRKLTELTEPAQVCSIYEDPVDKRVFIGTDRAMFIKDDNSFTAYPEVSLSGMGVAEGFLRDNKGNHWIAGHLGLVLFDGETFRQVTDEEGPSEFVWGLVKDYRGNIWATGAEGLFICNPDSLTIRPSLPEKDNLPASVIRDMGDNRLMVGRMTDVCIIDLGRYYAGEPDYYHVLSRNHGFTGNDCQNNGIVRSSDGEWWILTSDGLFSFDPDRVVSNDAPPLPYITSVEGMDKSLNWSRIREADSSLFYSRSSHLTLQKKINALRINFTAVSTTNPEEVTFNYRLKGYDNSWAHGVRERSVSFDRLDPGNYLFELTAFNDDGVGSEEPRLLEITVMPAFMQTLAAKITAALLIIVLIVFLTFQVRHRIMENRLKTARNQAEAYKLQLNSVIKQFDPHFTFNAVTSVGSLIMKGEKEKAYSYFIKLSNLLRSVLTDSSVLLKPLSEEIDFVTRYCELQKLRFGNRFNFEIKTDDEVDRTTPVPKMIIQSFVENSVKHGLESKQGKGRIDIYISSLKDGLGIVVRDNGIGRSASSELQTGGGGLGLKNIRSLINTLNRGNSAKITFNITDLYDENMPSGTEVSIFLPQPYNFNLFRT